MEAYEKWKETLLFTMDDKQEIIAMAAFSGGEEALRGRVLESVKGTLARAPDMQKVVALIEEM